MGVQEETREVQEESLSNKQHVGALVHDLHAERLVRLVGSPGGELLVSSRGRVFLFGTRDSAAGDLLVFYSRKMFTPDAFKMKASNRTLQSDVSYIRTSNKTF